LFLIYLQSNHCIFYLPSFSFPPPLPFPFLTFFFGKDTKFPLLAVSFHSLILFSRPSYPTNKIFDTHREVFMISDPTNLQAAVAHAVTLLNKASRPVIVVGSKVRVVACSPQRSVDPILDMVNKSQYLALFGFFKVAQA
jgi:hypothetical protein